MNSFSPMESLQWDWENIDMLNASTSETPRKLRPTEWDFDGVVESGSLYSSGVGPSGGSSGSDLGYASFSRSSKSSITSSSLGGAKGNKFTLEGDNGAQNDFSHKKSFAKVEPPRSSPPVEVSVGSGEPLLGLKLGKRTYFEDVCAGNNAKGVSSSVFPASSVVATKRSKASTQNTIVAYCQVEGCNLDLSSAKDAKDYHRKHRVCVNHSKSPKVVVGGLERRFCQQCSRFHDLSEFDENKRSCRRRLSDHNARRRKPPTELVAFNSQKLSASPYVSDGRHEISFVWNDRAPYAQTKPRGNFAWDGTFSSKSTQMEGYTPTKVGRTNGELQLPWNEPLNAIPMHNHDPSGFLFPKAKCSGRELLNQDVEESSVPSSMSMTQALSLLSTDSWGSSSEPKQSSFGYPMPPIRNTDILSQPLLHTTSQGFPRSLSENWQFNQQPTTSQVTTALHSQGDNQFQEFQLFRAPYEGGYYSNHIN